MPAVSCHVCGGTVFQVAVPEHEIRRELDAQREFVFSRFTRKAAPAELKDLTDFMHGAPAPLVECANCGLLFRHEENVAAADDYEEDPNDPDLMAQLYPRYLDAFRRKRSIYQPLLQPHASVLEIGSHLGGFLQAAEEWNWRAKGIDVGKDTSEFARRLGFSVARQVPEDFRPPANGLDAVFVWNCFEQIPDPMTTLAAIYPMLKRHGRLIVRVPNVKFYLAKRHSSDKADIARRALHYNNLLGFPYLYGYRMQTLDRVLRRAGFELEQAIDSELLTSPFADVTWRIAGEQSSVSRWLARSVQSTATGPWLESVYRKLPNDAKALPL